MREMLTVADREEISRGVAQGLEFTEIAVVIGRDPSVISREVGRHGGRAACRAGRAERAARVSRQRPKRLRLDRKPVLRESVVSLLRQSFSPEQVAGRLRLWHPDEQACRVSHEAIYSWIHARPVRELERAGIALRSGRTRRRGRSQQVNRAPRISGIRWIDERPAEAADRAVPGHWEGDIVIGAQGKTACITLVERTSRFLIMLSVIRQDSVSVTATIGEHVVGLPFLLRKSLTWYCGKEMARHADLTLAADLPVFFAHPHCPWERDTNENTNRLVREYLPKGTEITTDRGYLATIATEINRRPRRILGFRTPAEVFADLLTSANASTN
ncbi:IS30 family transposase [Actinokineospora spheciospongiae]|uniref:IS30 family transposase n=1 Tax=Actinokineospora spheciospongiae TaxID=909613 RepID=UPI000D71D024|nr:IS30 family transposase [Actinokineospora spheciospongiae]PWW60248.1 IS30 family transposase [Actinokineospora spheciospongiae]